ncbi:hydroxyectoine utilization dehydratase EutB [Aestuariispira insulae]|uniref:Threonine dehydratase n=1 Tax=Aestuariispira insulae TaxID=1461337 RepID=A0A3D9H1M9_9PROT|nr:hydroxyectoine utilization dehydratase EutB [Aestuariispira insulae]RED43394.1 threonine dehydratase [Aestuariispira insulae]
MSNTVNMSEIYVARRRISGHVLQTPARHSASLSGLTGSPVHVKWEQNQITGSFKLRGATNAILSLSDDQKARGVVGVSTGNHGRALAYAASRAGVRAVICMSDLVPENKVSAIRSLGADVRIIGKSQDDAEVEVERLIHEEGMTPLPPFDHPDIIAGAGTVGLELIEALPDLEAVYVPLSGGGLLAGVARVVKAVNPDCRVIGVSMERGSAMYQSQKVGKPILVEELPTLADALGGGIGLNNRFTFNMVRDLVDDLLVVPEAEIADAIRHAYWEEGEVIEGSGAVGIAALKLFPPEKARKIALVASGKNLDMTLHHSVISGSYNPYDS